jgi:hypothetical protein
MQQGAATILDADIFWAEVRLIGLPSIKGWFALRKLRPTSQRRISLFA